MEKAADEDLVRQYVESGELRHVDTLVRRHITKVRAMLYSMVLNDDDADDLAQEVFCRAIAAIHGFNGRSAFSTWIHRIAVNTALNFLRRRKRNPVETREELPDAPAARHSQPDETVMAREQDHQVATALAELTPNLRVAIVLTCIQGLSVREAAKAANCPAGTMYWRVHQARKHLRKKIPEDG